VKAGSHYLRRWSDVIDALTAAQLEGCGLEVALCIARQSIGWRRDDTDRYCSATAIAKQIGRSESTVRAALRRLQDKGIIVCLERGRATLYPSRYRIPPPVEWRCQWRGTPPNPRMGTRPDGDGGTGPGNRRLIQKEPPPPGGAVGYWDRHGETLIAHSLDLERSEASFQALTGRLGLPDPSCCWSDLADKIEATGRTLA